MAARAVLVINADRSQLVRVRAWVADQARTVQASQPEIDDLVLAIDEAVTNVIVHGYHDRPGLIELEVMVESDMMTLILRDQAPLFDPTCVPPPDLSLPLEQRPIGGMGIHLMRHSVDRITYASTAEGGNQITLVKFLERKT